jgi:hypothetical protein
MPIIARKHRDGPKTRAGKFDKITVRALQEHIANQLFQAVGILK